MSKPEEEEPLRDHLPRPRILSPSSRKEKNKWFIVTCILSVLTAVLFFSNSYTYKNLIDVQTDYNSLYSRFYSLQTDYNSLYSRFYSLQTDYNSLKTRQYNLERNYNDLQRWYSALQSDFLDLQKTIRLEEELRIGNSLESYYDYLRQELMSRGVWGQDQVDFAAKLALHDLGWIYWPRIEDDYYKAVGSYSYQAARKNIDAAIAFIESKSYDTQTERIKKILNFVHQYIRYESEVDDVFLAPVETLAYRSGDCEDFAILVAALLEYEGIDTAIGFFKNDSGKYHAMVLAHMEGLEGYAYWYYSDLTRIGLEKGTWIIIEPQYTIDSQSSDRVRDWNLLYAAPLDV